MNQFSLHGNERLRELLAAEFALGTLRGGARRRFERWLATDAALAQVAARWQARLQPMAELVRPERPPQRVWDSIERRLALGGRHAEGRHAWWRNLNDSIAFWRGLGLAASAAALVLAALVATRAPAPQVSYVATLSGENARLALVVAGDAVRRTLTVKPVALDQIGADRSLELWALPAKGAPLSLGLLSTEGVVTLSLPPGVTPQATPMLAVSVEPKGGSRNPHAPSGPVVYKGEWTRI